MADNQFQLKMRHGATTYNAISAARSTGNVALGSSDIAAAHFGAEASTNGGWSGRFANTHSSGLGVLIQSATSGTADAVLELRKGTSQALLKIESNGRAKSEFTAKAWVNWNGTGTVAIRDSHNVSSISDHGTGDYTVNFSSALGNSNYSFAVGWEGYQDNDNDNPPCKRKGTTELASGSCRFIVNNFSLGSKRDIITLCAQFFGG
jgi:hypothetical protein